MSDDVSEPSAERSAGHVTMSASLRAHPPDDLTELVTLDAVLEQIPSGVVIVRAPSGRIMVFNDEAQRILGHHPLPVDATADFRQYGAIHADGRPYEVEDHPLARALAGEVVRGETVLYVRGDGATIHLSANAAPLRSRRGEIVAAVTTFIDVTERRAEEERAAWSLQRLVDERTRDLMRRSAELDRVNRELRALSDGLEEVVRQRTAELAHQAQHDHLTGLPNRLLLEQRLQYAVAAAARSAHGLAVLFLDLDGFKLVNDTFGHNAGDEVLQQVAERLASSLRVGDTLARLSGDEFVVLVPELRRSEDAALVAQSLLDCLREPFYVRGREMTLSASIGVSVYPDDAMDVSTLQRFADAAMYLAKDSGKNRACFYASLRSAYRSGPT